MLRHAAWVRVRGLASSRRPLQKLQLQEGGMRRYLSSEDRPRDRKRRIKENGAEDPVSPVLHGLAGRIRRLRPNNALIQLLLDSTVPMIEAACSTEPVKLEATQDYFGKGRGVGIKGRFRRAIFSNNYVNLEGVKAVGFDYDYTLVDYKTDLLELIYNIGARYLVNELQYPTKVLVRAYDPKFAIRGLTVDTKHGLLIKLSYLLEVAPECIYRGLTKVSREEANAIYGEEGHVTPKYRKNHIKPLNDLFSQSEACLLANTIQGLIDNEIEFDSQAVAHDVAKSIAHAHASGKMHRTVEANPSSYIEHSGKTAEFLRRIKEDSDKKLFLASNSDFPFVNAGMTYIVGEDWRDLFDVVIVSADKPGWYTKERKFREINPMNGRPFWNKVRALEKGSVYCHGSIAALENMTGWRGHDVMYFGDSLWADLVEARRLYGWYTGAIIRELDDELRIVRGEKFGRLVFTETILDELLRAMQDAIFEEQFLAGNKNEVKLEYKNRKFRKSPVDELVVKQVEAMLSDVKDEIRRTFNERFGSCFRAAFNPTQFAFSLHRYCDLYTASIANCADHEHFVHRRFYPKSARSLPHEPAFPKVLMGEFNSIIDAGSNRQ